MIQGGDPTGTGMGGESIMENLLKMNSLKNCTTSVVHFLLANAGPNTNGSQFFIVQNQHLPYSKKEIARGGWPEAIAEIYAEEGGTPHLDRRHTVFGQLMDEASYQVLDTLRLLRQVPWTNLKKTWSWNRLTLRERHENRG